MIDTMFGSGSPMWTLPSAGFVVPAPIALGNATVPTPVFGSSGVPSLVGGFANGATLPTPATVPAQTYGYGAGILPPGHVGFSGPGFGAPPPFAHYPSSVLVSSLGADATSGVTVPVLLATVAMRRGQPQGPTTDHEIEDFIYDAFEWLPGAVDVEIRCEGGRATLTGTVQHKRVKRDLGEIVWAIPSVSDVQNNVTIASRRRARGATREGEASSSASSRKQA